MIRFVHTADIHFGVENYGKIDPATGIHTRLLDFERALDFCIEYAIKEQVDFFLFSGDAYKTTNPSPTQQRLLLKCFLKLHKAQIPLVMVVGNHDNPLSFGKAHTLDLFNDLPLSGFHVMAKPHAFVLQTKSGPVNIVGLPWPNRTTIATSQNHMFKSAGELTDYISQSTVAILQHLITQLDPHLPSVLAGHLTVSSGIFSGSEKRAVYGNDPLFLPSQLAIAPFDYVGLGHLHRFQDLNEHAHPPVVYSGSPERIDFGERKEEKGFCDVRISQKGKTSYEFIKTPARPFIQIEVHLQPDCDHTQQILDALKQHDIAQAILKIVYHVPPTVKDTVDLSKIERTCASALHVVGIIPVHQPKSREKRSNLKVDMDLETILDLYFSGKPELAAQKEMLIAKALALKDELATSEIMNENN
ncbi:exonuclease subunit SbcD [Candidatus Dependentiae bacterium]|nr:exonuclease subunit SbcD [Candidatus Dependentiae bacterium]